MTAASKSYIKGIHERFAYIAAWMPNVNLKLGDVGIQEGDTFRRETSLEALGIPFTPRTGANSVDFTYTSQSGVKLAPKAGAELSIPGLAPAVEASAKIDFSEEGAFLFQANGCWIDEIEDRAGLGTTVLDLLKQGKWKEEWGVIDTIVRADTVTILVSNSDAAGLELSAKSPIELSNLAKADIGISVTSQSGDVVRFLAAKGLSPLFKLSRPKRSLVDRLLGRGQVVFRGARPAAPAGEDVFEEVVPELD